MSNKYKISKPPKKSPKQQQPDPTSKTDAILPMQEPYMQQIVRGEKTFEFRRYLINPSVQRIWFYRTAPYSSIEYVCEIAPARTLKVGDPPLPEDGLGNVEYNSGHEDYVGYDYAYEILSVYQLERPIKMPELRATYGLKSSPRGLIYTPIKMTAAIKWRDGRRLLVRERTAAKEA